MANCRLSFANKQKQDRAHKQAGDKDADRNEHPKLRKTHGATQHEREKTNCGRERAKENSASKFCHRGGNSLVMRFSVGARLVIAPDDENGEINAEPDENAAEADADHAEPSEQELSKRERDQTTEEKANGRAHERQPSAKTCKENRAYQRD